MYFVRGNPSFASFSRPKHGAHDIPTPMKNNRDVEIRGVFVSRGSEESSEEIVNVTYELKNI